LFIKAKKSKTVKLYLALVSLFFVSNIRVVYVAKQKKLRMVDLLVNPPLTLYFFTEMQSGNEKTRLQVERQDVVHPDG